MAYALPPIAITGTQIEASWGNAARDSIEYLKGASGEAIELEHALELWSRTTAERDALINIDPGAMVYNASSGVIQYRGAAGWEGYRFVVISPAAFNALAARDPHTAYLITA